MYVVISIHHPRTEYLDQFMAFIASVEDACRTVPGFIEFGAWYDDENDRLVELSMWESQSCFEDSLPLLATLRAEVDPSWTTRSGELLRLGRPRRRSLLRPPSFPHPRRP